MSMQYGDAFQMPKRPNAPGIGQSQRREADFLDSRRRYLQIVALKIYSPRLTRTHSRLRIP
jgi:hypothetical protein